MHGITALAAQLRGKAKFLGDLLAPTQCSLARGVRLDVKQGRVIGGNPYK